MTFCGLSYRSGPYSLLELLVAERPAGSMASAFRRWQHARPPQADEQSEAQMTREQRSGKSSSSSRPNIYQLYRRRRAETLSAALLPPGVEAQISHVIPSLELSGTREQKLRQLDAAMTHLEDLRGRIGGSAPAPTMAERPGAGLGSPAWPWLLTGLVLALVPMLLLLAGIGR
jgi:hypothetical protein